MKKVQVLGTGCPKCKQMAKIVEIAAENAGIEIELEKVTELAKIMSFGVMMTPALVIDGVVKIVGKVPTVEEVVKLLK